MAHTKWSMLYGSYHRVHVIWSISYGPSLMVYKSYGSYHMDHMIWFILYGRRWTVHQHTEPIYLVSVGLSNIHLAVKPCFLPTYNMQPFFDRFGIVFAEEILYNIFWQCLESEDFVIRAVTTSSYWVCDLRDHTV